MLKSSYDNHPEKKRRVLGFGNTSYKQRKQKVEKRETEEKQKRNIKGVRTATPKVLRTSQTQNNIPFRRALWTPLARW